MHCSFLLICIVALNTLIISHCCPPNCVMCLNVVYVCNKFNTEQNHSGIYDIGVINSGAFVNADFVTLLDLSFSSINTIENGAFQGLDNLINFNLSENDLTLLHDGVFLNMPSLEVLDLTSNVIRNIQVGVFEGLGSLKSLYLSGNQLSSLPDGLFTPLLSLQTLDLSNNNISSLNMNAFTGLGNLTTLILSSNRLTSVSDAVLNSLLSKLPSLKEISISDNQWRCDCNITSIIQLMNDVKVDNSTLKCSTPLNLTNTSIVNLNLYKEPLACYEGDISNVTYGVQDIIVSDAIAPTIVLVCVFSYTNNTVPVVPVVVGCLIELVLIQDETISFIETGNKTDDDDEAVVTIETVLPGSYNIRVYNIYSNNNQSSVIAYKIDELSILPQQSSIISSVTITSSFDGTESTGSSYSSTKEQLFTYSSTSETRVNSTRSTTTTNTSTVIVAIAIAGCIVSAMVAVIVISCILVLLYRKRKGSKYTTNNNKRVSHVVPVVPNPVYEDPIDVISQSFQNTNIIVDFNPSYSHVVQ